MYIPEVGNPFSYTPDIGRIKCRSAAINCRTKRTLLNTKPSYYVGNIPADDSLLHEAVMQSVGCDVGVGAEIHFSQQARSVGTYRLDTEAQLTRNFAGGSSRC